MTTATMANRGTRIGGRLTSAQRVSASPAGRALGVLLLATACASSGCMSMPSLPWSKKDAADSKGPVDSFVLQGEGLERGAKSDSTIDMELEAAKRLFQEKEYTKAEPVFAKIAKNKKVSVTTADDAHYYEAASQYYQGDYRAAESTFKKYLKEFRTGAHAEEAGRHLFEIANYWLDPTRKLMQAYEEQREKKRTFVWEWPAMLTFHFTRDMPVNDREGHALACLEEIRYNDIGGPLGEKALFYIATVKFFREDYKDADYYYSQVYEHYPNSPLAPKAVKQSIICKQLCTGGSCYDCRTVEESRKLIHAATGAYPQMIGKDQEWIQRQLISVNLQQADRDYKIAEFYRRTGHPGSAYFYYELVRRRYARTEYGEKALAQMNVVRDQVVREQGPAAAQPGGTQPGATPDAVANGQQPTPPRPQPPSTVAEMWQRFFGSNNAAAQQQNPIQQTSGTSQPK